MLRMYRKLLIYTIDIAFIYDCWQFLLFIRSKKKVFTRSEVSFWTESNASSGYTWATSREKPVFRVCDQVRLKPAFSATETSYGLDISTIVSRGIILSRQRTTKALIRLCINLQMAKTGFLMTWLSLFITKKLVLSLEFSHCVLNIFIFPTAGFLSPMHH